MSKDEKEFVIRRILVALDASTHSLAALEAAADLAASMEAALLGLFVEDINLLRLAGLPFARAIRYPSATEEQLDSARMERQLKVQAEQARAALAKAAQNRKVPWSFRVVRGQVTAEVSAAASEADLLTLGKASRSVTRQIRLGSTALAVATGGPRALLLVEHGVPFRQPVLVLYDGSRGAQQALDAATRLAKAGDSRLIVILLADAPDKAKRLENEVDNSTEGREVQVHYRRLYGADVQSLIEAVRLEGGGVLVLSWETPLLKEESIQRLLHEANNPVLLVR